MRYYSARKLIKRILIAALLISKPLYPLPSLDGLIREIEAAYSSISDLSADFTQVTHIALLEKKIDEKGRLVWKVPGRFLIEYNGDRPRKYISNGKKIWVYTPGEKEAETYSATSKNVSKDALEFLNGFLKIRSNYNIVSWKMGANGTAELVLTPREAGAPYTRLECRFGNDRLLKDVTIQNTNGNISRYTFSNIFINNGIGDDLFTLPKGIKELKGEE